MASTWHQRGCSVAVPTSRPEANYKPTAGWLLDDYWMTTGWPLDDYIRPLANTTSTIFNIATWICGQYSNIFFGMSGTSFALGVGYPSVWYPHSWQGRAIGIFGTGAAGASVTTLVVPPC